MNAPNKLQTTLDDIVEPVCRAHGLELVEVRQVRERAGTVLRITIDRQVEGTAAGDEAATGSSVSLADCTAVSRDVSAALDVHDGLMRGAYRLEVTSPGLERPLVRKADYQRFVGREAKVKTFEPVNSSRRFCGELLGIEDGVVRLHQEGETVEIPFDAIAKAHLVHRF